MFVRQVGLTARLSIYVALSILLMAADVRYQALGGVRSAAAAVFHPVQSVLAAPFKFFGDAWEFFTIHGELLQSNRHLTTVLNEQGLRLQNWQTLAAENAELRRHLGLQVPAGFRARAVEVVGAMPDPFSRRLVIGAGAEAGVRAGLPVVNAEGLIGQVTRVYPASSEVTLLTSHEQSAPVEVVRNGLRTLVNGFGSDSLLDVRYLDAHADLRVGDVLVTSGLDGLYPAGIPVGRVLRVEPPRHTPFARAVCEPLAGIGRGRFVTLLERQP